ncbi:decapping and exoribonuclease protein-like isoform X2 [Nylanderia fulva]|nr:decapping and exoribonuclease protein-like isoform X2 [Nylanderia fulva]XP_029156300.1 decapping and exoribonuclease protein-like isoform X2 [Nylanderia fulva]XP_029156301.1 decapping and exoribonuclease protein-like isoform X2 [Nylanderia fulva]
MKYYIPPEDLNNVSFDLNKNFMSTRYKPTSHVKLDNLLRWIADNFNLLEKPLSTQEGQWLDTDFICRRGVLKTLLCTPYKKLDKWIICASKYRGTIYLCEFYTTEKEQQHVNATVEDKQIELCGYKLEQYLVADHPSHKPDPSVLNECEKFHCIFQAKFGDHSLLYTAEIDGIVSQQPITDTLIGKTFELIEMKSISTRVYNVIGTPEYNKYGTFNSRKLVDWWSPNYLSGTERLICGLKNMDGKVTMIKEYPTHTLPLLSNPCCNIDKCKMFCKMFLDNVKKIVIKDYNESMYKFYFDGSRFITYSEIAPNDEMYSFLKPWFVDEAENYNTFQ